MVKKEETDAGTPAISGFLGRIRPSISCERKIAIVDRCARMFMKM